VEVWHRASETLEAVVAATRGHHFAPGEGLPGRIWERGEPIWLPDLAHDDNLPRATAVASSGLRSAFGFPIRLGASVLGVIEFFSRELRAVDAELLAIFDAIGAQIGLFIERRRAEDDLRALNADLERRVARRTRELAEANLRILGALEREQELGILKSNFITTVTHEFRTPLGVILSSAEMLQNYFHRLAPKERNEQLQTINDAVQRMAGLMEEVLLFHKVEGGVSELNSEDHDLAALCELIANEVASATAHRCEIECKITALPKARFDERLFRHIVVNLLNNAVKYSEPGCAVTVSVRREATDVIVIVRDRGIGIPEEDQQRLFVPFRRGTNVGRRAGTGLGLSIAKRCVDLHGGSLEISSKVGEGTIATLRMPVFNER
jgi:signal transduction histidine kinase